MANQYVNKLVKDGVTKLDLTNDTVTADTLLSGRTAHLANGEKVSGTFEPVTGVKGNAESAYRTGNVNLTPANLGLDNVNNTADLNKPISTATQAALDSQQEQINYNSNNGVKNLLNVNWFKTNASPTQSGTVEFLDAETGSITGYTPASSTGAYTSINVRDIPNQILENGKKYILSCNVDSLTNDGIFGFRQVGNNNYITPINITKTGEYAREYTHNSSVPVYLSLCINTTATSADKRIALSNVMLREIADDTFEPYAEPNSRLTQKVDKALEQTGYNLFKLTNQTITTNNVTFNVDGAAGTITATRTGTQTANAYLNLDVPDTVYGKLCLSGCADGGNANTYSVYPWDSTTNARPKNWEGTANAKTSISASDYVEVNYVQGHTNRVTIRITPTASFTTLTFKPMIVPEALTGIPFQPYAKSNVELTQDLDNTYIKHLNITCSTASGGPTVTAVDKTFTQIADAIQNGGLVFASFRWTRGTQIIYMSMIIDTFIVNPIENMHVITGTSSGGGTDSMYRLTWQSNNSLPTISNVS